ncbi:MAG TPA: inositol monophosphatase family protein [Syntrophales bacterium]|nr:inositol monophosphatase family protein [Syntrophales bacterium]HOD97329.1 inositol monophosphatase family protein [Syntrophales bacterium]HOH72073.1 inositol monophosphatase family protein [Syntrophales bacterium]HPN07867.1 inositol monophosphatase family protein [Syntrophales bacterium]HPX81459.1 inositol monophosphatase family protein [Syntrophales bacterium]
MMRMKRCPEQTDGVEGAYRYFAMAVAAEAGRYLRDNLNNRHQVRFKGVIDIVTEADQQAEDMIVGAIHRQYPHHDILAEESAAFTTGSPYRWIIDPLDGTTNYAHGYPVFCVSIALEWEGNCILGVVYNPMLEEMFVAEAGRGAYLNDRSLVVSKTGILSEGLLATGFPYDIRWSQENNMNFFQAMAVEVQAIRRAGSAALDLAYVAAGRFDGFWELKLHPWDTAAGCLLVREAGGTVTDLRGEAFLLTSPHVVASNGLIHDQILSVLQGVDKTS